MGNVENKVKFKLKDVNMNKSFVLEKDEIDDIVNVYINTEIGVENIYEIIDKINTLYDKKGYFINKATISEQKIENGIVKIRLIEKKLRDIKINGKKNIKEKELLNSLEIQKNNAINLVNFYNNIKKFNETHNFNIYVRLKQDENSDFFDLDVYANENNNNIIKLIVDNQASSSTGKLRANFIWQNNSLTGKSDSASLSIVKTESLTQAGISYYRPITKKGTKLGFDVNVNKISNYKNLDALKIKSSGVNFQVGLNIPKIDSVYEIQMMYQGSSSMITGEKWIADHLINGRISSSKINREKNSSLFEKYSLDGGLWIEEKEQSISPYLRSLIDLEYNYNKNQDNFKMLYNQQISFKNNLHSSKMFYLGGGAYPFSILTGEYGAYGKIEYTKMLEGTKNIEINPYLYIDGGFVLGPSAYQDKYLIGTGIGIRGNIKNKISIDSNFSFPLKRKINGKLHNVYKFNINLGYIY